MSAAVTKLDNARRMLAEVRTVADAVQVADYAAAAQQYARRAKLGLEAQNHAAEIKVRAERMAGAMLAELARGTPFPGSASMSSDGHGSDYRRALEAAEVSRQDAARWQKLAEFEDARFEELLAACMEREELTTAFLLRAWRRECKADKPSEEYTTRVLDSMDALVAGSTRFGTIYSDPPWLYGNQATRGATGDHYGGMSVEQLIDLPVRDLAADSAHLHLWTTNAFLFDARRVMDAWGFEYKSVFVWVKPQMGMGNYWRVSHEFCLFGLRGRAPFGSRSEMSWREWSRGRHSAKPAGMYDIIERVSPGPYLEMFARSSRPGWTSWGNEVEPVVQEAIA